MAPYEKKENPDTTPDPTSRASTDPQIAGPWPPEHLRVRVHGGPALKGYMRVGKTVAQDLDLAVEAEFARLPQNALVLDFGCGPGRVLTWLQSVHEDWNFVGTDMDIEAIDWATENLSHIASFDCNEIRPPLKYDDAYFDLVFCISVFTHLPEDMQTEWLLELRRVVKSGSVVALSVHGEQLLPQHMRMPERGFYYSVGAGTDGLPNYYQTSFQTSEYIQNEWSKILKVEKIMKDQIAGQQDLIICRRI